MKVYLKTFEGIAIAIELPPARHPRDRRDRAGGQGPDGLVLLQARHALNGVKTMVPPHIGVGTRVVILTEDSSYVERAKD